MAHRFASLAFTDAVKAEQEAHGSRRRYEHMESDGADHHAVFGDAEAQFVAERDSFYMATVSETGWPYIQHRGGPKGFVKVLTGKALAFADFAGNRQYISTGNLKTNDRVSLFFMDYAAQARLKVLGRVHIVDANDPVWLGRVALDEYKARVERIYAITVGAFDWSCSQHIAPRYAVDDVRTAVAPLQRRIAELEKQLQTGTPKE